MNASFRTYLLKHLAPVLSQRFAINLDDVKDVINTFDQPQQPTSRPIFDQPQQQPTSRPKSKAAAAAPKKRGPTKDDLLKEAKNLGLKVTTKMRKDEIQAILDNAKRPPSPPRARTPSPPDRKTSGRERVLR